MLATEMTNTIIACVILNPSKILTTEETLANFQHKHISFLAGSTTQLKRTKIIAMQSFLFKVLRIIAR